MELSKKLILLLSISYIFCCTSVDSRAHHHKKKPPAKPPIALPPAPPPEPPTKLGVYSVMSFGAVGDGVSDDTEAFKSAWDSACEEEGPGVIVAPGGYSFKIRSAIFAGPCRNGLVLQVQAEA